MSSKPIFFDPANSRQIERIERVSIGKLHLPTGRIVACDPFVQPETEPFTLVVPRGSYNVEIDIAHFSGGDQRIATAYLHFGQGCVLRWEPALLQGQDPSFLAMNEFFCYGVDAGTGCFMSPEAGQALTAMMDEQDDDLYSILGDEMEESYVHTRSWLNKIVDPTTGANLIAFSSGMGDGCYASYFGYGAEGLLCLVTDFQLFPFLDD